MNWLREPDTEPLPGYRLLEPIGHGGFGEVWKCLAPGGILKAIKFVYGNLHDLEVEDGRAQQELKALERVKQVRHPFLLSIEQIQEVDGELIIVMELADQNLHECFQGYQQRGYPGIPREKLLAYLDDAAAGLDYLIEKHNLQHLDIKPRNLFLVADRVKVADFGLVKTLERSSVSGLLGGVTPLYAAPETFANKISKHSDQYSLAIVYVELLTGRRPFDGKNIRQLALQHMSAPPDLSMLPEAERDIVAKALAKDPEQRFPSCTAFIRTLAAVGRPNCWPTGWDSYSLGNLSVPSLAQISIPDSEIVPQSSPEKGSLGISAASPRQSQSSDAVRSCPTRSDECLLEATEPQHEVGILRPSVMVGIGSFGRRALQEIRRRITDRLGDASQLPALRFLYVDCDPEAAQKASSAPAEVALHSDEILLIPLQPVTQYRRRQLEQILEWLPREKLYSIPRNLQAGGVRAFGRLAFCDHYLRFVARLRREIQIACHPESLAQTSAQTGLNVRDTLPQILIFASLAGGSGGMLLDVGYAIRRVLQRVPGGQNAQVTAFVYLAAPSDPTSPDHELANVVAGLTELHHYADTDIVFTAQYGGPDGPRVENRGLPFNATYLVLLDERSGGAFRRCLSRLASYVCNELTTLLGRALDAHRSRPPGLGRTPFRTFGVYSLWYPRGLLLRAAAQKLCAQLLHRWAEEGEPGCEETVAQAVARITHDERLSLAIKSDGGTEVHPSVVDFSTVVEPLRNWLQELDQQWPAVAKAGQGRTWARKVWEQTQEWLGWHSSYIQDSSVVRSRWHRTLEDSIRRQAEAWANEAATVIETLAELPGRRLAAIENGLRQIENWCEKQVLTAEQHLERLSKQLRQVYVDLNDAYVACQEASETFSLLGGRGTRALRHFVEHHRKYVHLRIQEGILSTTSRFFRMFQIRLQEKRQEVEVARLRLRELLQRLHADIGFEAATDTPGRITARSTQNLAVTPSGDKSPSRFDGYVEDTATMQLLLPEGEKHWEQAAQHLVTRCTESGVDDLDYTLGQLVLVPRGGLLSIFRVHADLYPLLVAPLIDQTIAYLANLLPAHDVAELAVHRDFLSSRTLSQRLQEYHHLASPPLGAGDGEEQTYLVVPSSEAGRELAACMRQVIPKCLCIEVPTPATDILFCREHGGLRLEELVASILNGIPIYQKACLHIMTNPHSRYDVVEWLPLWE